MISREHLEAIARKIYEHGRAVEAAPSYGEWETVPLNIKMRLTLDVEKVLMIVEESIILRQKDRGLGV